MREMVRAPSFSLRKNAEPGPPPRYETFSLKGGRVWVPQGDFLATLQSLSHTRGGPLSPQSLLTLELSRLSLGPP